MKQDFIEISINNKVCLVKKTDTVLQACERYDIEIPRFCYHEKLAVAGNCRMCLVEIEKSPKPVVSCAMPVNPGMRIFTNTPLVKKAREAVLEFLLINHPLDCPICDQGGECDLQDQALAFGSDRSRYYDFKRGVEDKDCGPIIKTIMTRCIHCTRCVRFIAEYSGKETLGVIGRGEKAEIGTYINNFIKTELSGNLVDLCPVGALTSKPYAFKARNWELKKFESVDFFDAVGSNILINSRNNTDYNQSNLDVKDRILRILPKANDFINEDWISDKTRYAFDGIYNQRIESPKIQDKALKFKSVTWDYILKTIFLLKGNSDSKVIGNFNKITDLETIYFMFQFLNSVGSNNIQNEDNLHLINVDIPLFYRFNSQLKNIKDADVVLIVGSNPRFEASMLNIKLRQLYLKKDVIIGVIGNPVDLTYPYLHIGSTTQSLIDISEGRHIFCKFLKAAKNPLIILGESAVRRKDSLTILNLSRFIAKQANLVLSTYNGYNMLLSNIGLTNSFELGVVPGIRSNAYNSYQRTKADFFFGVENINKNLLKKTTQTFLLNSHYTDSINYANFIFPIKTFYEKSSQLVNIEGRVQTSVSSVTPFINLSRNAEDIFKVFAKLLKGSQINLNNFKQQTLISENPLLKNTTKKNSLNSFDLNFVNFKENGLRVYLSPFKPLITNYYMTDFISQNSQIMAECSLFYHFSTNYKKNFNK